MIMFALRAKKNLMLCKAYMMKGIFKGNGWTISSTTRGYKGKFTNKIRPRGTPVDAPVNKSEADKQFQQWVDSGGLQGIKPTIDIGDKNNPSRPQTAEEQVDKKS